MIAFVGLGANNCELKIAPAPIVPAIELDRWNAAFIILLSFWFSFVGVLCGDLQSVRLRVASHISFKSRFLDLAYSKYKMTSKNC